MLRGRDGEVRRCVDVLERVAAGAGGAAVIVEGDAGMGKTTLVAAAAEHAAGLGFTVLQGRGHALGAGVAYGPVAAALGRHLHGLDHEARQGLTHGLASLARLVEGLGEPPAAAADPDLERSRLYQSVALLLSRIATHRPALVSIDDLHWADAASVELLAYLADELAREQVVLLVAFRPSDTAGRPDVRQLVSTLQRFPVSVRVSVGPLGGADLAALVQDRLGGRVSPALLAELTERTGGVALAVDAVLRNLMGGDGLSPGTDGWQARAPLTVPTYVVELFAEGIRKLDVDARDIVSALAIADEALDVDRLAAIAGIDADRVSAAAGSAVTAGLAREVRPRWWDVGHPLVAEATMGVLGEGERRRLHLAFANLLASAGDADLDRHARHVVGAGSLVANDAAAAVLARAGRRALTRGAMDAAARWLSAAGVRAGAAGMPPVEVGGILVDAAGAWERRGELDASLAARSQAVDLLAGADPAAAATAAVGAARLCWQLGRAEVDAWWARATTLARGLSPRERLRIHYELHGGLLRQGRIADAEEAMALVRADLAEVPDGPEAAVARYRLLCNDTYLHGLPASRLVDEAPALGPGVPLDLVVNVEGGVLDGLVTLGRWDEARARAAALTERVGPDVTVSQLSWRAATTRISHAIATGRWAEASDLVTELTGDHAAVRASRGFWLGVLATLRGEFDDARAAVDEALSTTEASILPPHARALAVAAAYVELVAGTTPLPVPDLDQRPAYNAMNHAVVMAMAGELAVASGRAEVVAHIVDDLRRRGERGSLPDAVSHRLVALAGSDAGALREAARTFDALGMPFDAARARLEAVELGGDFDRRDLLDIIDVLDGLGATPWTARARALAGEPVAPRAEREALTPREQEIALLVADGLTNGQIAERLAISIRTVTSHLDHSYTKLGIGSRAALVAYVLRQAAPTAPGT